MTLPLATASVAGLLPGADKAKIDQLEPGVLYIAVKNDSGGTISKGTPLYAKGTVGDTNVLLVAPSDSADPAKVPTIGLGINAPSGFAGRLLDLRVNGTSALSVDGANRRINLGGFAYLTWDADGYTPTIVSRYGAGGSYVFRDYLQIPELSFIGGTSGVTCRMYIHNSRGGIGVPLNTATLPANTGWLVGRVGGSYAASTGYQNGTGWSVLCGNGVSPTDASANGGNAGDFDVWLNSGGAGKGTGVAGQNGRLRVIDDDTDKPTFTVEKLGTVSVYNDFTSYTNYERGKLAWSGNVFIVGTEKGSGGGTARSMELQTDATTRLTLAANGATITAASGTALVADHRLTGTAPASATATGTAGDIRYDADYVYVCTATNTWKRAALSTW